jgi:diguanylate cyclase (GGDEF)-like protein
MRRLPALTPASPLRKLRIRTIGSGWVERADRLPPALLLCVAIALVAVLGVLDVATGPETAFSIFYLIPVAVAGGLLSRSSGALVSLLAAAVWGYVEITTGRPYSAAWIAYYNAGVRLGFFLIVSELIHEARVAHLREQALSRIDPVTGLANTRVFEEYVNRAIVECRRYGRQFTIAYVDLDGFKQVNDRFGHSEGDEALRTVAAAIRDSLRATETVARFGGDEFGILMPETGLEQARASLGRVDAAVSRAATGRWGMGATLGAVTFTEPPDDADSAVRQADALMYRGKAAGRGRVLHATWPEPAE